MRPTKPAFLCWIALFLANGAAGYAQVHGVTWALMFTWSISALVFAVFEIARVIDEKGRRVEENERNKQDVE